jgi:hypothetical protein
MAELIENFENAAVTMITYHNGDKTIQGKFEGTQNEAYFRFGGPSSHTAGFNTQKCLYIPNGHDTYGDDKFSVKKATFLGPKLLHLELSCPLRNRRVDYSCNEVRIVCK